MNEGQRGKRVRLLIRGARADKAQRERGLAAASNKKVETSRWKRHRTAKLLREPKENSIDLSKAIDGYANERAGGRAKARRSQKFDESSARPTVRRRSRKNGVCGGRNYFAKMFAVRAKKPPIGNMVAYNAR